MAVNTVQVTGKVILANGQPAAGGRIRIRLSSPGTVDDGGVTQKIGGVFETEIGSDGAVDFELVPNSEITPDETIYSAEFELIGGSRWQECWQLESTPDPIEIGDIPRVNG